jgi:hypothetical protein
LGAVKKERFCAHALEVNIMNERTIELFVQGEGIGEVALIHVPHDATVHQVFRKMKAECGIEAREEEIIALIEDQDEEIGLHAKLIEVGIGHRDRMHFHRCRRINVSVNFNGAAKKRALSPSTTITKIKRWADKEFDLKGVDATEHALQICGTNKRPDLDVHVGSLVQHPDCEICFDLVPKQRVEG